MTRLQSAGRALLIAATIMVVVLALDMIALAAFDYEALGSGVSRRIADAAQIFIGAYLALRWWGQP